MNYILLSKEMSCALRHEPQAYGLELDEFGAVDVNTFVEALRKKEKWKEVTIEDGKTCHLACRKIDNAWRVGLRKDPKPVIFRVDALRAFRDGIGFYHGNDKIWLSDNIPAVYISVECNLNAMENGNDTL